MDSRLTHSVPFMNLAVRLPPLETTRNFVVGNAQKKYRETHQTTKKLSEVSQKALENFESNLVLLSKQIKKNPVTEPHNYIFRMSHLLVDLIENYMKYFDGLCPDNKNFIKSYDKFRIRFAIFRYKNDSKINDLIFEYLQLLQKATKHYSPIKKEQEASDGLEVFQKIISTDIDVLEASLGTLCGMGEGNITISAEHVLAANNILVGKCLENIPWVLNIVEEKLRPFSTLPQDPTMNFAANLLEKIARFRKNILPKIPFLSLNDLSSCKKKHIETVRLIEKEIQKWTAINLSGEIHVISDSPKNSNPLTKFVYGNKKPSISFANHETFLNATRIYASRLIQSKEAQMADDPLLPYTNEKNLENIAECQSFHTALLECHMLLDAYFFFYLQALTSISSNLNQWFISLSSKEKLHVTRNYKTELHQEVKEEDINAIVAHINLSSKSHAKKKRKSAKARARKKALAEKEKKSDSPEKTNSSLPSSSHSDSPKKEEKENPELTPADKMAYTLEKMIENTRDDIPKSTARHALMYLKDMVLSLKSFSNASDLSIRRFYLIMLIQSAYFYLEQLLQLQQVSNDPSCNPGKIDGGHNLIRLLNEIGLSQTKKTNLLQELFLANFWVRNPYEQIARRKEEDIPPLLHKIQAIYEADSLNNSRMNSTIQNIKQYVGRACLFSSRLPLLAKEKCNAASAPPISGEVFNFQVDFKEIKRLELIMEKCKKLQPNIPYVFQPKFKQIFIHLEMIKGIFKELGNQEIPSNLLSLLTRALIFWENALLEGFMQVLYGLQTGIITNSHQTSSLCSDITWDNPLNENQSLLLRDFDSAHQISRFPFSQSVKEHPLLDPILQTELLRERPDLGIENPFTLTSESQTTHLNYLNVSKNGFSPKEIVANLHDSSNKIMKIIQKKLLRGIESQLIPEGV